MNTTKQSIISNIVNKYFAGDEAQYRVWVVQPSVLLGGKTPAAAMVEDVKNGHYAVLLAATGLKTLEILAP